MALSDFIEQVNEMKVGSKAMLLNYAHLPRPSMVIPGAKILYPPSNALIRLGRLHVLNDYLHIYELHKYMYVCTYACIYVCIYVCKYVLYVSMYTYMPWNFLI